MVKERKDANRAGEDGDEAIAPEADPTLDIVRQMIVEAEAIPAPAQRPRGPATPRPDRADIALPRSARQMPDAVPVTSSAPEAQRAAARLAGAPEEDATEDWAEDMAGDLAADLTGDLTGDWNGADGDDPWDAATGGDDWVEDGGDAQTPPRDRRTSLTGRLLGGLVRLGARMLGGLGRLLWTGTRRVVTAIWRRLAAFMRRPDAPRRLALAIIAFSVFVWTTEVLWLTLLIPLAALITWASVGNEGCVELVIAWYNRLKARDAAKAERIRARAAAVTRGLNRGLERLPQNWTQGLYLPDFETDGYVPEKLKVDPFEELAARVHSAKRAGDL